MKSAKGALPRSTNWNFDAGKSGESCQRRGAASGGNDRLDSRLRRVERLAVFKEAVERGAADAKESGGANLVAADAGENAGDMAKDGVVEIGIVEVGEELREAR